MNERQQILLDHYHDPRNFGKLSEATNKARAENLSCGDEIEVYLQIENGIIKKMTFEGEGCSIAISTASLWTEKLIGMTIDQVLKLDHNDTLDLIGMPLTPSRLKCAMLSLNAIKKAVTS